MSKEAKAPAEALDKTILDEIKEAIEKATFQKVASPPPGAEAYEATSDSWRILVLAFKRFGARGNLRGYDGTASGVLKKDLVKSKPTTLIVHLTPELAQLAVERAEKQVLS